MEMLILLLPLPAVVFWGIAAMSSWRAVRHIKPTAGPFALIDPVMWWSEARARQVLTEEGIAQMRRGRRAIFWFLGYCAFMAVVLVLLASQGPVEP